MSDQGTVYAAFVDARLKVERDRRAGLESRAANVVTSSAALVSLVFALVAVVLGKDHTVASGARWGVIVALALFAVAGIFALVAGMLRRYTVPDDATLNTALGEHWTDTETTARLTCAWLDLDTLLTLRRGNNQKTWWLDWALRIQLIAAITLAFAVGWELYGLA